MRPLTIVTGIILGSAFSIALGLAVVMLIFLIIGGDYPQVRGEQGQLGRSLAIFVVLTAVCAMSFLSLVKKRQSWLAWQAVLWATVALTGAYFWPA